MSCDNTHQSNVLIRLALLSSDGADGVPETELETISIFSQHPLGFIGTGFQCGDL